MYKEALEVIDNKLKHKTPYEKTAHMLKYYRYLKEGKEINDKQRNIIELVDQALKTIENDRYYEIIENLYKKGYTYEKTRNVMGIDKATVYRQRKRLIKTLSVVIYGDEAL